VASYVNARKPTFVSRDADFPLRRHDEY